MPVRFAASFACAFPFAVYGYVFFPTLGIVVPSSLLLLKHLEAYAPKEAENRANYSRDDFRSTHLEADPHTEPAEEGAAYDRGHDLWAYLHVTRYCHSGSWTLPRDGALELPMTPIGYLDARVR